MTSVLITGASRGIGRAVATELAGRGHRVVATARRPEDLKDLPVDQRLRLDVTDQKSIDDAIRDAGEIDVLVSNAGDTIRAPLESVPMSAVEALFQLNTFGPLRMAQGVLPGMRERGTGRLIFVSSIQGRMVVPIIGPYAASKWAMEAFAETIAAEAGHFGVKVTILQPSSVSSGGPERAKSYFSENDPYTPLFQQFAPLRGTSIFEPVTPEDVAVALADTLEKPDPPLRLPVGRPARTALAARKAAPDDAPFLPLPLDW
ncbi:SDR family oxidoreductase [Streptomyces liangshanensis]|uniref:SDR family oxidoreductase n=1 Tax=Streptomyces liangshanensis TaxID=2717324 RepID=A0A6G9GU23_9ACTN|nr:SDR family oxidoreductase [Streptomyces liangshanensis]QIQ01559.1 SDR family oxidoreductase [Streptomyces liangshanensis]